MFGNNSFTNTSFGGGSTFGSGFGQKTTPLMIGAPPTNINQPTGTTIKFAPATGQDTVQKSGASPGSVTSVLIRYQNICAMKEYENKSVDELRVEDYQANRKMGQLQNVFNSQPTFQTMQPTASQPSTSLFGSTPQQTTNLFGTPNQNQNKSIFGQNKTGFELNSTPSIFNSSMNKPTTTVANSPFSLGGPFNTTPSTSNTTGFSIFNNNQQQGFGAQNTSLTSQPQPFGQTNTGSIFSSNTSTNQTSLFGGATTTASTAQPFGGLQSTAPQPTTSLFNTSLNTNANKSVFPTQSAFGSTPFGMQPATSQPNTSLFGSASQPQQQQQQQQQPSTNLFGSSPFGAVQTATSQPSTSLFGSSTQQNTSLFGTPSQTQNKSIFGQQPKTGFELNSTPSIFNSSMNKPTTTVANSPFSLGGPFNTTASTSNATGFSIFNNNQQQGFGAQNTSLTSQPQPFGQTNTGSIFSSNTSTNQTSLFGGATTTTSTAQPFGGLQSTAPQPTTSLFNTSLNTNANKSIFPTQTSFGSTTFGLQNTTSQSNTSLFGNNNQTINNVTSSPPSTDLLLNRLKTLPYGETSLLSPNFTTDPKTIDKFKMSAKTTVKLNKMSDSKNRREDSILFDGPDEYADDEMRCAIDVFVPKKSIKKLGMKPNSHLAVGDVEQFTDSPPFERTRSSLRQSGQGTPSADKHVRYADNSFPGDNRDTNASYMSANLNVTSSDPSSIHNDNSESRLNSSSCNESSQDLSVVSRRSDLRCGLVNSRPDYRLKPKIDDIERRYDTETDTCIVDSLLIERPNYGSILFESPLDVKGVNIDETVLIRRKEVVVYPDDEKKPPIGQGLNRPAVITLHQVWPVDKTTNTVIKDIDRLNLIKYPEKIEALTLEKGARFIEYRPETGSWVFSVKHFSKYGITDDDEEAVDSVVAPINSTALPAIVINDTQQTMMNAPRHVQPRFSPIDFKKVLKNNMARGMTPSSPMAINKSNSALFETTLEDYETQSIRDAIDELFEDNNLDEKDRKRFLVKGNKRLALQNISPNVTTDAFLAVEPSVPEQQKIRELSVKPDLFAAKHKLSRDIMSTCVAGSPKVRFFDGSRKFCLIKDDSIVIHELSLLPTQVHGGLVSEVTEKLETFLTDNSVITPFNTSPTLAPYIETDDFIKDAFSHDLLHALHGNLKAQTPYAKQDERMTRVVDWLATINQTLTPPTNIYQLIIYHMSCDRYDLASKLAIDNDHPRLAMLLSTSNLNKDLMQEQLGSWRLNQADQYIDPELIKIYILLSGRIDWKLSNDVTIYCLKDLVWTQQLCLLAMHVNFFSSEPDKYGFHLLPAYIKRLDTDTNDVDYHILARHSPAEILSAAKTLLDEWFLLESLKSFHVINSETECSDSDIIHCNLASQLASVDLRWACFVATHIVNNEVRNQVILRCLEQNHNQLKTTKQWLIERIKIPQQFISHAEALSKNTM